MTHERTKPRSRAWVGKIAMVLLSLGVALVVAEIGLRILTRPITFHAIWPANSRHVFRPARSLYPDTQPETTFRSSSIGLRAPELSKSGDELRVLAIGGSTTECLFQDEDRMWTALLSKKLAERTGRKVWVGNAGRSGLNSGDHVLHAKYLVDELPRLDAVVMLVGVNDVNVALSRTEEYLPTPEDPPPDRAPRLLRRAFYQIPGRLEDAEDYQRRFYSGSQVYQLLRRIKRSRNPDLVTYALDPDDTGREILGWREKRQRATHLLDEVPDLTAALATYKTNLLTIQGIAERHGTRLILMTQPTLWRADMPKEETALLWMGGVGNFQKDPNPDYYSPRVLAEAMRQFNQVTLDVCRERGVECLDLAALIPKSTEVFYDDCHFGERGSERIATLLDAAVGAKAPFIKR